MPTVQQILNKVDLYRNSYTPATKVDWMDTVQKQIFQDVPHEAPPFNFTTISGFAFYALPSDCDPLGVKKVTIETKTGSGKYRTLKFLSVNSTQMVGASEEFYSIQGNENIFLNPLPDDATQGRNVYLIYNKRPATLSATNLNAVPDLEEDFHELLELGVKIRIARERLEKEDELNFKSAFNELFRKYQMRYKLNQPDFYRTKDVLPKRNGSVLRRRRFVADLIPESVD